MKYEITIRNHESDENHVYLCDECLVIGITNEGDKKGAEALFHSNVQNVAVAIAGKGGHLLAAARHAVAFADGRADVEREEAAKKMKTLAELLKGSDAAKIADI